jgi:hypothetical protein
MSLGATALSGRATGNFMDYIITATDSAGALSLKRESAAAAIKKTIELLGDGCRDVCITDPEGRIHSDADFDQLLAADKDLRPHGRSGEITLSFGAIIQFHHRVAVRSS